MTTDVQPYTGEFAILKPEFREVVEENFGGEISLDLSTLPTVVWPGTGGRRFIVKTGGGEREEEHITGVVVAQRKNRALYLTQYVSGSNTPPDCSSQDGEHGRPQVNDDGQMLNIATGIDGEDIPFGGDCKSCPLSQWDSRQRIDPKYTGPAQACREGRVLLILPKDKIRPYVMRLPVTAIRAWSDVTWDLTDRGLGLSRAVLDFSLEGKSGEVPVLKVAVVEEVSNDDAAALKGMMPSFKQKQLAAPVEATSEEEFPPF